MDLDSILERFALLADLTSEQAMRWKPLCKDAMDRIQSQCRETVDTAEQSGVLCAAVSALAFYQYTLGRVSAEGNSFAAGDVKVSQSIDGARALWLDSKEQLAPLLRNNTFYFGALTGGWDDGQR